MRKHVVAKFGAHIVLNVNLEISSCLKGSQKASVIAFVEQAASFTKFQVNIYRK